LSVLALILILVLILVAAAAFLGEKDGRDEAENDEEWECREAFHDGPFLHFCA
jgi:hypothetical protein